MQPDELARKRKLLAAYKRRKDERDLQAALLGVGADPIVEIEREELAKKIEQLEHELRNLGESGSDQRAPSAGRENWFGRNHLVVIALIVFTLAFFGIIVLTFYKAKSPYPIVISKAIPVDPTARYSIRAYNCDDICQVYVGDRDVPIVEVTYTKDSGWVDITRFLNNKETAIKVQVINTDKGK